MNPFNFLDRFNAMFGSANESAADLELEAKKDRIEFHRRSVRNGPISFKTPTQGQLRRAGRRGTARMAKKSRRAQVKSYFAAQREAAVLRGNLQAVGVLAFSRSHAKIDPVKAERSIRWFVVNYLPAGELPTNPIQASMLNALHRWQDLVGLPHTSLQEATYDVDDDATAPDALEGSAC